MTEFHNIYTEPGRIARLYRELARLARGVARDGDREAISRALREGYNKGVLAVDGHGVEPIARQLDTAVTLCQMVDADRSMIVAILIHTLVTHEVLTVAEVEKQWGKDIAALVEGLVKVESLYRRRSGDVSDNFRKLLLTFAQDIRVIIIMIVDRLALMRAINHHPDEPFVMETAYEAGYLYAPLAHRLGLYAIKSELEDMSLKYTHRDIYTSIAHKLNQRKAARDAYIADFIAPIRKKLDQTDLRFEIKGRTKSIYSIWNKMKKQGADLDHIYDLFAIRIILDSEPAKEKSDCWNVYSVVTDMYQPNPSRLKDWLSIPKSNGYESLHITVNGPGGKWVEVQIRTRRMDAIAERGLAAHWKYKGIQAEQNLDAWMNNVRDILEAAESGPMELMKNMKMDVYDKEVFVFTPKGDLYRLPLGASVLDFAFNIHSRIGEQCTGGRVNGKNQKINYKLHSGDTVEILTSSTQKPKLDWLNFVVTSKARSKIKQKIKEEGNKMAELGRELLSRRFKNRKIDMEEAKLMRVVKKMGYKMATDFFKALAEEQLDPSAVIDNYLTIDAPATEATTVSAEEYVQQPTAETQPSSDVLVIGNDIKGLNYRLAKCCNPIYGDPVFGFVSAEGVIKVHREDCPNARNIRQKYPYRIITTRWSGKLGDQLPATLRVVGQDDIGIVTNITSIINKEGSSSLRSISIDSHDGLFQGYLVVGVKDNQTLNNLIKKILQVKGVKDVQRSN